MSTIELLGSDGLVRGVALVDPDIHAVLSLYRWHLSKKGYACRTQRYGPRIENRRYMMWMHREVLGLQRGDPRQADHINRDKLDNRRANLRLVTNAHNARNLDPRLGTSRYRGVHWNARSRRWIASARLNYQRHYLGTYRSEHDAHLAVEAFWAAHPVEEATAA